MDGSMSLSGSLKTKKISPPGPGLSWHFKNRIRPAFWLGWLAVVFARAFSRLTGIITITSSLSLRVRKADGSWVDYGVVGYKVVTTVGVGFIVDAFQNIVELENMKYHGLGTGGTAEASSDTALVTELTTEYNPNSTRATGSTIEGATANVYRSVGTNTVDGAAAVTEHGLFDQAATGGGVLLDRTLFSVINLAGGDSLQSTYDLTLNAGS